MAKKKTTNDTAQPQKKDCRKCVFSYRASERREPVCACGLSADSCPRFEVRK